MLFDKALNAYNGTDVCQRIMTFVSERGEDMVGKGENGNQRKCWLPFSPFLTMFSYALAHTVHRKNSVLYLNPFLRIYSF